MGAAYWLCGLIGAGGIAGLIIRVIVCTLVSAAVLVAAYSRTDMFRKALSFAKQVLKA